jgi:uncharacterized protein
MKSLAEFRKEFHVLPRQGECLLFHPRTFSTLRVRGRAAELLMELAQGKHSQNPHETNSIIEWISKEVETLRDVPEEPYEKRAPTLYLNVSGKCNLECVYCYANFGAYQSEARMMTGETAVRTIDRFMNEFGSIGTVVFFGGEPLIRDGLISEVCDYALTEADKRSIEPPRFSIVTNGTLLKEKAVELLARYQFGATVSVDGPATIHNLLRPKIGGQGSFSEVEQGLLRLKERGIRPNIECTFTAKHLENGIMPKEIIEFFKERFESPSLTLAPVASIPSQGISLSRFYDLFHPEYLKAARYSLESYNTDRPIALYHVQTVLNYLLRKTRKRANQFCYANLGADLFSVSAKGSVYPCQMMNDRQEFEMGNVLQAKFTELPQFREVREKFESMNKDEMQCKSCWAQGLCFMCVAGVEIETGKLRPIPKHRCDLMKGIIDEVLVYVSEIQKDRQSWDRFCENVFAI